MKLLNGYRMSLVLIGFVVAIVLGGASSKADFRFGEPIQIGPPIWSQGDDPQGCCFSRDGLELYLCSTRPGGFGGKDIWVSTRETIENDWGEPINLGSVINSSVTETEPTISPDGLELYFDIWNDWHLRVTTRPSRGDPWSNPTKVGPPVGSYNAASAEVSADGLSLYFASYDRPGGYGSGDIWVATRETVNDEWGEPVNLGPTVNSSNADDYPSISSDGLALFFASNRPGSHGNMDIWVTTRKTTSDFWDPPVNYIILNDFGSGHLGPGSWHLGPAISPDGSVLYFERGRDMWQSTITPIVDLNGDGIADAADVCIMVEYWGTDESLCDIGPMPWGDGIVDVQDLIVLAEHLFEEFPPVETVE